MFFEVLNLLKSYLESRLGDNVDSIKLSALSKAGNQGKDGGIVITLLHIQEESSVKSQIPLHKGVEHRKNPDVVVNIYVLISAQDDDYETALKNISSVIAAFQANSVLPVYDKNDTAAQERQTYKLALHSMSLEQNLGMWQTLGDKLMPSVVYKVSAITVQTSETVAEQTVSRVGIAYERHPETDFEKAEAMKNAPKSSKTILGKGEDVVFERTDLGPAPRILSDEERTEANLPVAYVKEVKEENKR